MKRQGDKGQPQQNPYEIENQEDGKPLSNKENYKLKKQAYIYFTNKR